MKYNVNRACDRVWTCDFGKRTLIFKRLEAKIGYRITTKPTHVINVNCTGLREPEQRIWIAENVVGR